MLKKKLAGLIPTHGRIDATDELAHPLNMSTLTEIETAAADLPPEDMQELMIFLGARLRAKGAKVPQPREFSRRQLQSWIADDEAELEKFRAQK